MSSGTKAGLSLAVILVAILLPLPAHADEFLTKSPALYDAGIKLYVGENQKDAIVFHMRDIGYIKEPAIFVLTSTGAHSLKGKLSYMDLQKVCGNSIPGIGFKKKGYDGFLVAVGKDIDKYIKFFPAQRKPTNSLKSCLSESPKEPSIVEAFSSIGIVGTIQQVRWKRSLTKEEIEKQCDGFAKWNVKIDNQKSYEDLYNKCISGSGWHCSDEERVVISLQDNNGKCLEITNAAIDCDGQAPIGVNLREFLGVLKVEYHSRKEVWLLWNAPGYEGDGIYAVEVNDISNKPRHFEEWLVYNGC